MLLQVCYFISRNNIYRFSSLPSPPFSSVRLPKNKKSTAPVVGCRHYQPLLSTYLSCLGHNTMTTSRCRPVVICGPSGVGKGTLIELLQKQFPDNKFGVSLFTRYVYRHFFNYWRALNSYYSHFLYKSSSLSILITCKLLYIIVQYQPHNEEAT